MTLKLIKYLSLLFVILFLPLVVTLSKINYNAFVTSTKDVIKTSEEEGVKPLSLAKVTAKADPKPKFITTGFFTCQVGFFSNPDNAEYCMEICEDLNLPVFTQLVPLKEGFATRILVGRFKTREAAERYKSVLVTEHHLGNILVRIA